MTTLENDPIFNEDLYTLLDLEQTATTKEIQKSWRLKSLQCHPDKFPDDDAKAALFIKITKALDILTDSNLRAIYDQKYKARAVRLEKKRKLDSTAQKFREELDERERRAKRSRTSDEDNERELASLAREIAEMRDKGFRTLRKRGKIEAPAPAVTEPEEVSDIPFEEFEQNVLAQMKDRGTQQREAKMLAERQQHLHSTYRNSQQFSHMGSPPVHTQFQANDINQHTMHIRQ